MILWTTLHLCGETKFVVLRRLCSPGVQRYTLILQVQVYLVTEKHFAAVPEARLSVFPHFFSPRSAWTKAVWTAVFVADGGGQQKPAREECRVCGSLCIT